MGLREASGVPNASAAGFCGRTFHPSRLAADHHKFGVFPSHNNGTLVYWSFDLPCILPKALLPQSTLVKPFPLLCKRRMTPLHSRTKPPQGAACHIRMNPGQAKAATAQPLHKSVLERAFEQSVCWSSFAPEGFDIGHVNVVLGHSAASWFGWSCGGASPPAVTVSIPWPACASVAAAPAAADTGEVDVSWRDADFSFVRTFLEDVLAKSLDADDSGSWNGRGRAYVSIRHADHSKAYGKALLYPCASSCSHLSNMMCIPNESFVDKLDGDGLIAVWTVLEQGGVVIFRSKFAMYFPKARMATRESRVMGASVRVATSHRCPCASDASTNAASAGCSDAGGPSSERASGFVPL